MVLPILRKPSATAHMKGNLVLTHREVIEHPGLSKAIRLQIMPHIIAQVTFIKIDMKNADFRIRLIV